ncbi:MAG: hypothetical protein ABF334_02520 [Akkermansiaceae bacterium]
MRNDRLRFPPYHLWNDFSKHNETKVGTLQNHQQYTINADFNEWTKKSDRALRLRINSSSYSPTTSKGMG